MKVASETPTLLCSFVLHWKMYNNICFSIHYRKGYVFRLSYDIFVKYEEIYEGVSKDEKMIKLSLPWTDNLNRAVKEFKACKVYNPESSTCTDLIVSDEVVELNVTLFLQASVMILTVGVIITMISLNIHAPKVTLVWLKSVTLLPTGKGFSEAYILWLYAGARSRKQRNQIFSYP